ncbi:MAG: baseplate J/gp47 family protein [Candidatus Gastranaerophilaceae bacterium]
MYNAPDFINIDAKADKEMLIKKYEKETDTTLYPAQDAMILINLMVYYANLVKTQMNEAAKLNLVECSKAPILDFLGRFKNCERTKAHPGVDVLKIVLNTTFSYNINIASGFQVKTADGEYIFVTTEDLIIPAGETTGYVEIESLIATSEVNKYNAGEINTVISSAFSYIDSVENINGVTGGSDDESDEHYIERILLAPEGFSVAGPEAAYIYFALSAHPSIIDAAVDVPSDDATVEINNVESVLTENTADNALYSTTINYQTGEMQITLKEQLAAGTTINVKIPHPYRVNIYTLTEEGETPQVVLNEVSEKLKPVKPLSDYTEVHSATVEDYTITGTVYLYSNADEKTVKTNVNRKLKAYVNTNKNKLKNAIVTNKITTEICSIKGVYDFALTTPSADMTAAKSKSYKGTIGNIEFVRVSDAE